MLEADEATSWTHIARRLGNARDTELSVDILAPGGKSEGAIGECERTQSKDDYIIPDVERTAHDKGNGLCRNPDKMWPFSD